MPDLLPLSGTSFEIPEPITSPSNRNAHSDRLTGISRQCPVAWWGFEVDPRCQSPLLSSATVSVSRALWSLAIEPSER